MGYREVKSENHNENESESVLTQKFLFMVFSKALIYPYFPAGVVSYAFLALVNFVFTVRFKRENGR